MLEDAKADREHVLKFRFDFASNLKFKSTRCILLFADDACDPCGESHCEMHQ